VHIAYQVIGDGPFDLVFVPGYVTHMELQRRLPGFGGFLAALESFSRLIRFDKRGTGMSDPVAGAPSLETRMDDVRAVMDAVGSRRAAFYGLSEGAAMSLLFAATYPGAIELGDRRWRELLEQHQALIRRELLRFRGTEIDTTAVSSRRSTGLRARSAAHAPSSMASSSLASHPSGSSHGRVRSERAQHRGYRRSHRRTRGRHSRNR
jgi:pimeloyl-ACP methyl ester carboxylesterase